MADYRGRKLIVVTGATSGIGLATAIELARRGHRPVIVGRSAPELEVAQARLLGELGELLPAELADLSRPHEVDALADRLRGRFTRIDALINNAGVLCEQLQRTPEGHELTWATNLLGPFRLTARLLPHMIRSGPARVINVASNAHRQAGRDFTASTIAAAGEGGYDGFRAYARSKLALIAFTRGLAARVPVDRAVIHSLHPGIVGTSLAQGAGRISTLMRVGRPLLLRPARGALTPVFLACSESERVTGTTGGHWWGRRRVRPSADACDPRLAAQIWSLAVEQTGVDPGADREALP